MNDLQKQVKRARGRLVGQQLLIALVWSWFGALLVAAVLIGIDARWQVWSLNPWYFAGGSLVLGSIVAGIISYVRRPALIDAAIELDHRFSLRERVSSVLALGQQDLDTPAGQALVSDAVRRVGKVDVGDKFGFKMGPVALLPLAPALLAFAFTFIPAVKTAEAKTDETSVLTSKQIKPKIVDFRRTIAKQAKKTEAEKGLKDMPEWMKKLEAGVRDLEKKNLDQKKTLVELNKLEDELAKRRNELGGAEKLKEQLKSRLDQMSQGPADKLGEALKQGDFNKALDELQKLQDQIKNGDMNEQQKQKMMDQMAQMQQKLQQMAQAHKNMQQQLKQQMNQARQAGQDQLAQKLQQQLQQMKQMDPQMQQMQQMAQKLGECAQCMKNGDQQGAAQQMQQMQQQLQQLAEAQDELDMLQEAMNQLGECKAGMCQMPGQGNQPNGKPGNGLGKGRGFGERPETEEATNRYQAKVNPKYDKGTAIRIGEADGPNLKGNYKEEISTRIEAAQHADTDPLTGQRLPRGHREHAKEYFNKIRKTD